MFRFFRKKTVEKPKAVSAFTTDNVQIEHRAPVRYLWEEAPLPEGVTQDSIQHSIKGDSYSMIPQAQADWYMSQSFLGYGMMALIAKNPLVDKACNTPARDAIRRGYNVNCDCEESIAELISHDKDFDLQEKMKLFIHQGRVYGGQAALFVVDSNDPDYYENPFNLDGVGEGEYKGISLIDPEQMMPVLTAENVQDPASLSYMKPTYWMVGNRKYHHSHFVFFVPYPVSNKAKPTYNFFGVSVPERIYERVYAAERTANEAPMLTMTKRLGVLRVNNYALADKEIVGENLSYFTTFRDNYGVYMMDKEDEFNQLEKNLADLDATIMTQYQLVAALANIPATKLLGTTPKGFNSTGEYEESSYREELESIANNDLSKLLIRHYTILSRSLGLVHDDLSITWRPIDSPTAIEQSQIEVNESAELMNYANSGAIDGYDIREILRNKKGSKYEALSDEDFEEEEEVVESEPTIGWNEIEL